MEMRARDIGAERGPVVQDNGAGPQPEAMDASPDWRLLFERERARAEASEQRADRYRRAEIRARSEAARSQHLLALSHRKHARFVEETRELPRSAKKLERELARSEQRLARQTERSASYLETIGRLHDEGVWLRRRLRYSVDQDEEVRSLREELKWLRGDLKTAHYVRDRLKERLVKLRAGASAAARSPARAADELRKALRRSRRQKTTIHTLQHENARLRKNLRRSRTRREALEAELAEVRASRAVLSKWLYGRRSEQQDKPRSPRPRGQQRGAPGHGRTQRPALAERVEVHDPPPEARVCADCGQAYVPNGAEESTLLEIEVAAHKRVIRRSRWRRVCDCEASPREAIAPPPARLFPNTSYGASVWARFLFERYGCLRPLHRVAGWLSEQGLEISPGTLSDSVHRFRPLFEGVAQAILAHQHEAAVRHGDETGWRIESLRRSGRSPRAWLWTSVTEDAAYFHVDASRSAEVAGRLFGGANRVQWLVCDRYSAYRKMARETDGAVILALCWAHQRRDFIHAAAGDVSLTDWCRDWIARIANVYHLNKTRLAHHDPAAARQDKAFAEAQRALASAVDRLFADAGRELAALPDAAPQTRPLRALLKHREGLCVFVGEPRVPMDNNLAERALRGAVIGRRLSFGSDSEAGATFTAVMYSVLGTLSLNGIDVRRWLEAWLGACAGNGGQAPDPAGWLPWSMSASRRRALSRVP